MDRLTYISDPCGASALPLWKTNTVTVPDGMLVVRDDAFVGSAYPNCSDEPYFKMQCAAFPSTPPTLPSSAVAVQPTLEELCAHICLCYDSPCMRVEELRSYRSRPVFDPALWVALRDTKSGKLIASGIAELDRSIEEGVLEWIQVSPACRRKGYGQWIVTELMYRMREKAAFVTVSGRINSPFCPERLYRACGFQDRTVWHILTKHPNDGENK